MKIKEALLHPEEVFLTPKEVLDHPEFTKKQKAEYDKFWRDLKDGFAKKEKTKFVIRDKEIVLFEVYTPIKDENGIVKKILKISNNISDFEEL